MAADLAQETIDYVAICRLQAAYADSVTRRAWVELEALFRPKGTVTVDTVTSVPIELVGPSATSSRVRSSASSSSSW